MFQTILSRHCLGNVDADWHTAQIQPVNPFTIVGSNRADLSYGQDNWIDYSCEGRFYFGIPKTLKKMNINELPADMDFFIAQGDAGTGQVAFGWQGTEKRFALLQRSQNDEWKVLETYTEKRPAISNWVRLGLTISGGTHITGSLDNVAVINHEISCLQEFR